MSYIRRNFMYKGSEEPCNSQEVEQDYLSNKAFIEQLNQSIEQVAEKKLNQMVVQEVEKSLRDTIRSHKRVMQTHFIKRVVLIFFAFLLLMLCFYAGLKIAFNDEYIKLHYQKLVGKQVKDEINLSVSDYFRKRNISAMHPTDERTISDVYQLMLHSVVGVFIEGEKQTPFGVQKFTSSGSGVIIHTIDEQLYIVTNYHVIENYRQVHISLKDNAAVNAQVVGFDKVRDLAVLQIDRIDLPKGIQTYYYPVTYAIEMPEVGSMTIAIGNPLGYKNTVTAGIVSATDRVLDPYNPVSYIQTDAAINPGNSGGALVDRNGQLIGINTAKIKELDVEGIGFSIPVDIVYAVVEEIMENGTVKYPFVGIRTEQAYDEVETYLKIVDVIKGTPADTAGLKAGDRILKVDGQSVLDVREFKRLIFKHHVGDVVTIHYQRGNEIDNVVITLAARIDE